ncbi:MAG TPA: DUF4350 domain-containing protein, partial [Rudaea sp.]
MNRNVLITLVLLVPVVAFVAWWLSAFERVEEDVDLPLHGEARYNPYYGLAKVLRARGFTVESRANLNLPAMALADGDTLILGADVRTITRGEVDELIGWVEEGGHLLFALPPGAEGRSGELIEQLGLTLVAKPDCVRWTDAPEHTDGYCFAMTFKPKAGEAKAYDELLGTADEGYWLGRHAREDGMWTVVGDLKPLQTRRLQQFPDLAWQLIGPTLQGKIHIVYAADVLPLHVLLVRRGWPALVPALLALLAWLWTRSQRFGPLLPLADPNRRALLEHIRAAGEFAFRRGRPSVLYAPVRRLFDDALRRDDPAVAALEGDALVQALAARS